MVEEELGVVGKGVISSQSHSQMRSFMYKAKKSYLQSTSLKS